MPRIAYTDMKMADWKLNMIFQVNAIVADYRKQGYSLTLRQVYYQFVARDLLPQSWADPRTGSTNNERSYNKLGNVVSDGRMCGLIDWMAIEDRTREMDGNTHWNNPQAILAAVAKQYLIDKWEDQPYRPEVWVEKDALEGVVGSVCRRLDIPFFSCRGYTSQTAMWQNATRLKDLATHGQQPVILHLGDHDPSGIDMSRDIEDRVRLFMEGDADQLIFERIALNMDQVKQYRPPENPAKVTDSRADGYMRRFGESCWELDALEPRVISDLIETFVAKYRDDDLFEDRQALEETERDELVRCHQNWPSVVLALNELQKNRAQETSGKRPEQQKAEDRVKEIKAKAHRATTKKKRGKR